MKAAGHIALAVGVGYVLGRKRKLRAALLLGAAAATGKLGKVPAGRLLDASHGGGGGSGVGGGGGGKAARLGDAGKAAARTALGKPIEMLSDRLNESAEALRRSGKSGEGR